MFWTDGQYFGPAAIVNAHRFIFDSRDDAGDMRLEILNDKEGVWRCRTTFNCSEACPRGIQVTQAIAEVKQAILVPQDLATGHRDDGVPHHVRTTHGERRRRRIRMSAIASFPLHTKGDAMSRSEKVTFEGSTGELLSGIMDVPEGPVKGWGVFSHGFTLGKDSPSASRMCKALADNGVGMLRFDNLGLGESAGLWSEGSFSHKVADTVKAAEFMRDSGQADFPAGGPLLRRRRRPVPPRGRSRSSTPWPPWAPRSRPSTWRTSLTPRWTGSCSEGSAEVDLGGKRVEIRRHFVEDLENADLTDCIQQLHKPLMVLHSPTDNTVGIENASTIFQTARHPRSFVSLEGSDHLLTGKGQAARAAKIISAWADQYLDAGQ